MFLLPAVDLTSVLTPEIMAPILANPEVQQRLMPYLPSGESLPQSTEELNNTLSSPQFQQVCLLPDAPPPPVVSVDSPVFLPLGSDAACEMSGEALVVMGLSVDIHPLVVVSYFILLGISLLCAGHEHVQQRSGVRAVGASDEPVWFACRGC